MTLNKGVLMLMYRATNNNTLEVRKLVIQLYAIGADYYLIFHVNQEQKIYFTKQDDIRKGRQFDCRNDALNAGWFAMSVAEESGISVNFEFVDNY